MGRAGKSHRSLWGWMKGQGTVGLVPVPGQRRDSGLGCARLLGKHVASGH